MKRKTEAIDVFADGEINLDKLRVALTVILMSFFEERRLVINRVEGKKMSAQKLMMSRGDELQAAFLIVRCQMVFLVYWSCLL